MYGLYVRDLATADLIWFTTAKSLEPGAYLLGRHYGHSPNVYVSESIPALVLRVGPLLDQAEESGQSSLSTPDIGVTSERRIASEMTDGLLERLTETSSIWAAAPDWVDDLRPVIGGLFLANAIVPPKSTL
jgi:hypothetical protein